MRLTLEPTTDQSGLPSNQQHPRVVYEIPGDDDAGIEDLVDGVKTLLIGWGFSVETVQRLFAED